MKRQLPAIVLLLCMTAPFFGTFTWLSYEKNQVRRTLKKQLIAGIEKDELVLLKFTPEESSKLRWEHDKEFEYNHQMYDVVAKEVIDGVIHYWCWWDHEETQLNKKLQNLLATALGGDMARKEKKDNTLRFYSSLYYSPLNTLSFQSIVKDIENNWVYITPASLYALSPPNPPPKTA